MRKKRLTFNIISALMVEAAVIISGFILPRLILKAYGSEVNGLVASVTQFLSVISLLEMGLGVVIPSALFKPLAEHDNDAISRIMVASTRFFRAIAGVFLIYVAVLILVYPYISNSEFGFGYTASLIAVMCISNFTQYYFGISNGLLLDADQHGYIQSWMQFATVLLNTAASAIAIKMGASIQAVKLITAVIFLARPIYLYIYVRHHYDLNWKIGYDRNVLEQKWVGLAQHIANAVLTGTDVIVLTVFSTLSNVSVYNVYYLVINGINTLLQATRKGLMPLLGDLWARKELDKLKDFFQLVVWGQNALSIFVFGCTAMLIGPFVRVYTAGITDVDYQVPLFAVLITVAYMWNSLRVPYHVMILAANHYRQTQKCYIIGAALNLIISVATVMRFGLVGVAVGTLVGMSYQTVWMAWYNSKELAKLPFKEFVKRLAIDVAIFVTAYGLTSHVAMSSVTYLSWFIMAVKCALVWGAVVCAYTLLFYRKNIELLFKLALKH